MRRNLIQHLIIGLGSIFATSGFAVENAKVLPKGARNLDLKSVFTSIHEKSDSIGVYHPIAEPLAKEFTFRKVLENEKGINKMLLKSFMQGRFSEDDSLGHFTADMKGNISILAGVLSYGVTEHLTLAIGVPFYQAKMNVKMGFEASPNALRLVEELNTPGNNQPGKSREIAAKITNAVGELNQKLLDNGYQPIQDFSKSGIGDITLAAKYQILNHPHVRLANAAGTIAPTGYAGDSSVPINIPFGTGSWGFFNTFYIDEPLTQDFWFNQYFKYTYQLPTRKTVRLKTEDETITVPRDDVRHKIGDRFETGISAQYEPSFGLIAASGLSYTRKHGDRYSVDDLNSKSAIEKDSHDWATYWEAKLGYQSIPAFLRKEFPIPFNVTLEMKRHLRSANTVVKDLYTFDFNLFF